MTEETKPPKKVEYPYVYKSLAKHFDCPGCAFTVIIAGFVLGSDSILRSVTLKMRGGSSMRAGVHLLTGLSTTYNLK